ncbi:MAG TPA: hypothetical protein VJP78_03080 [Thermoleophilia bacterium]|nr:hypothetical protein [Thermoleophilia bacterium]
MSARGLDIERLMEGLVLRNSAPISPNSLRLAMALEIREAVPDSRMFIGLNLRSGEEPIEMDILGLVGGQQLAVKVCVPQSESDDWSKDLEELESVCSAVPDLVGLALIVSRTCWTKNGNRRLAWRSCAARDSSPWREWEYAFTWIDNGSRHAEEALGPETDGRNESS